MQLSLFLHNEGNANPPVNSLASTSSKFTPLCMHGLLPYLKLYRSPSEIPLTLLAFTFFFFAAYCTCLSNALANRLNTMSIEFRTTLMHSMHQDELELPLKDPFVEFMFYSVGRNHLSSKIPDYVVLGSLILLVLFCFSRCQYSLTVIRRTCYILGAMYLIRAPVILMTFLPNPEPTVSVI
ncbi:hypothetical protein HMI55_007008, partial [Coelomomyces lativittatus]